MYSSRCYSLIDRFCLGIDQTIRTLTNQPKTTGLPYPADKLEESVLSPDQSRHAASLMRVNHAGEICAQALYHGQSMVSRSEQVQKKLQQAAIEEGDHLNWCKKRLDELDSHVSYLNVCWYTGSFAIGMLAGLVGDRWSLGFVAETERQVVHHLERHMQALPKEDQRSFHILKQMEQDEAQHRDAAIALGAKELPFLVKKTMTFASKIMVKISYWI